MENKNPTFRFANAPGKVNLGKPYMAPSNSLPGHNRNESMRNKSGAGKNTTTDNYNGKSKMTGFGRYKDCNTDC